MNSNSCILEHPSRGRFLPAVGIDLKGSCLHYSTVDFQLIRSGKVVINALNPRNDVVLRNKSGHIKKEAISLLVDGECFYTLYPSRLNENQLPNQMEHFENLTQYCGFCFNQSENVDSLVSTVNE